VCGGSLTHLTGWFVGLNLGLAGAGWGWLGLAGAGLAGLD